MLALFKEHQEALKAAQDAATNDDELANTKRELEKMYEKEKKKLKAEEKKAKREQRKEKVEAGLVKKTKRDVVDEANLLDKEYEKHSRWNNFQEAREAMWDTTGGEPNNLTSKSGRVGSSYFRSHHLTSDFLAYKISAASPTAPAISSAASISPPAWPCRRRTPSCSP